MKTNLLVIVLLIYSLNCLSQQPIIEWQKTYGGSNIEYANSIKPTTDDGYIVAGNTSSTDGDITNSYGATDCWVIKLSSTGIIQWQKSYGGSQHDMVNSIQQTFDKGYIFAGTTFSNDGDVTNNNGAADVWIVKTNENGIIQWQKSYGGSNLDYAFSIQQTEEKGYIVAGRSNSNDFDLSYNHGDFDYWIFKIDKNGTIQWQKSLGGSEFEEATSISQTTDGGYIIAGESRSNNGNVSGNHGQQDFWIVKVNNIGEILWQKSLGGSSYDKAFSVQQTTDGGYIVAGGSWSDDGDISDNNGGEDFWIVKLNNTGIIQWQKSLGGSSEDSASSIQETDNGGYIITGFSSSNNEDVTGNNGYYDIWTVKIDVNGNILWQKSLGGSGHDAGHSVQQTNNGGYIVAGLTRSFNGDITENHGETDFWLVKFSAYLGLEDNNGSNELFLYPNPSNGVVNIEAKDLKEISIYNSLGMLIFFKEFLDKKNTELDVSGFSKGIYTVTISAGKNKAVKKLLIN